MPARIIPDVYTEVRAIGLATSAPFGLNTVGIVGTAGKGVLDTPTLISSKQSMYDTFGEPGEYRSTTVAEGAEKTLVRAGALAFDGGAPQIYFTRIGDSNVASATRYVTADDGAGTEDGYSVGLEAVSEGSWGNDIRFKVETSTNGATVENVFLTGASDPGEYEFDTYDGTVTPDTTQFTYLQIPGADTFEAVASPNTRIELQRASGSNYQRTTFNVIHTDASYMKSSGEVDQDSAELIDTATDAYCQSFYVTEDFVMSGAILRLKNTGTATGNLVLSLYLANAAGAPITAGGALATSANYSVVGMSASFDYIEIDFTSNYTVYANNSYCLVLSSADVAVGSITWAGGSATDDYTNGVGSYSLAGGAYTALTNCYDLLFQPVYVIPADTCVFIMNDWGTNAAGTLGTKTKKIVWSEVAGSAPTASTDTLYLTYDTGSSMKFILNYGNTTENYFIVDGYDLIDDIMDTDNGSNLVTAAVSLYGAGEDNPEYYPIAVADWQYFGVGAGASAGTATLGHDGAAVGASDYADGIATLEAVEAHIILAAGQYSPTVHAALQTHVDNMEDQKKERVAVAGHRYGLTLAQVMSSNVGFSSKRTIFVSPGITTSNHETGVDETVSAAYAAALFAGYMAANNPSFSPLGKSVPVGELETSYTNAQLEQVIMKKINPIRAIVPSGFKWGNAVTASIDSSWQEVTTVRITDFATIGVRSACDSFVGEKNLASKRNSINSAVSGFLGTMAADEMFSSDDAYNVVVSSTRAQQVAGIVQVDVSFQPVFAIKYILVTEYVS